MNIGNLTFSELKQASTMLNLKNEETREEEWHGQKVMLFMTHGFIFVGDLYSDVGGYWLDNAWNCRYQEEGQGWGHIARMGKRSCSVDDYQDEPLHFYRDKILFIRKVDADKWS